MDEASIACGAHWRLRVLVACKASGVINEDDAIDVVTDLTR